jgi:flavin-dependent dehydrogenase
MKSVNRTEGKRRTQKIAICGAGFSGLLLAHSLSKDHEVTVFDLSPEIRTVCGWGIPTSLFQIVAAKHGLDPGDYILCKPRELIIDQGHKVRHIPVSNLCTFHKEKFMRDLVQSTTATFKWGQTLENTDEFDAVVDATGKRDILGKLPSDKFFATYQVKVIFPPGMPEPDFYMGFPPRQELSTIRYLWQFPLSEDTAFVGCMATNGKKTYKMVNDFLQKFQRKSNDYYICAKQARVLRLGPPQSSLPFFKGNVVGVGNSIGAITSFGEGNELAALTADLLAENISDSSLDFSRYQQRVLKCLAWLESDYKAYEAMTQDKILRDLPIMLRIQGYYRRRFGINLLDFVKNVFR